MSIAGIGGRIGWRSGVAIVAGLALLVLAAQALLGPALGLNAPWSVPTPTPTFIPTPTPTPTLTS